MLLSLLGCGAPWHWMANQFPIREVIWLLYSRNLMAKIFKYWVPAVVTILTKLIKQFLLWALERWLKAYSLNQELLALFRLSLCIAWLLAIVCKNFIAWLWVWGVNEAFKIMDTLLCVQLLTLNWLIFFFRATVLYTRWYLLGMWFSRIFILKSKLIGLVLDFIHLNLWKFKLLSYLWYLTHLWQRLVRHLW